MLICLLLFFLFSFCVPPLPPCLWPAFHYLTCGGMLPAAGREMRCFLGAAALPLTSPPTRLLSSLLSKRLQYASNKLDGIDRVVRLRLQAKVTASSWLRPSASPVVLRELLSSLTFIYSGKFHWEAVSLLNAVISHSGVPARKVVRPGSQVSFFFPSLFSIFLFFWAGELSKIWKELLRLSLKQR